ncbi:MAG: ATP-binding protein [Cytophagaceae bacterium]
MKIEIAYSGVKDKYLSGIKKYLKLKNSVFTELPDENYEHFLVQKKVDALIIGEEISNPIRLAQYAYSADKSLSILIISEPSHYKNLKQAILFTPFIGPTVNCISDGDEFTVANKIDDLIHKTHQRRNYESLKKIHPPVYVTPKIEQLKKEYINKFFEKAPVGAILLGEENTIIGLNYQASHIFKVAEKDLLGKIFYYFFPNEEKSNVKVFIGEEYKVNPKRKFLKSINPEQHVELAITEVNLEGNFTYKVVIVDDITNTVVKDRQIQNQLSELKKINADLDNFIYTASHDLKSPISNIEGLVYTLKDIYINDQDKDELGHVLELLEKSINRFRNTIQDLTDIAKIQKNISEDIENVEIKETIGEVLESIEKEIRESNAKIIIDSEDCTLIRMSKANFKSVIYNLVSNAIKYRSPDRSPLVEIRCRNMEDYVLIQVKDNGLGISETNKSKMFTMFKRFHSHVEGTGIGLYIVKRILDNSGGKIEVESQEDKGTHFKVYFRSVKG